MYHVVWTHYAGMVGISCELSAHKTTKAAWRKLHGYRAKTRKNGDFDSYYSVVDDDGNELIEVRSYINGRWVSR